MAWADDVSPYTPWTLESRGDSSMIQGLSGTGLLRQAAKRGAVEFLQHLSLPMSAVGLPGIAGS